MPVNFSDHTPPSTDAVPELEDSTPPDLSRLAKQGVKLLLGRQAIVQVLTFAGGVVLARTLDPAEFGLFGIATFLVNTLALLGDFGLAPSLIQRKEDLLERDLQVGFTLQQGLITTIVVILWFAAPTLVGFYPDAPEGLEWLVRALAFSLYLTTWRSMSALQLERCLEYKGLAVAEVVESLSYQAIAVGMAVAGFGVWSLVVAVLARGLLGTVLVYSAAPWRVRFAWDGEVARDILRYGIPYQARAIIYSAKDWVGPTLVAGMIGPQAVGFLTWAGSNGGKPLVFIGPLMRVAFPYFSRLQEDHDQLEATLERYAVILLLVTGMWFSVIAAAGEPLTAWIYGEKWLPAVLALIVYSGCLSLNAMNWMMATVASSTGQVGFALRVAAVRSVVAIGLGVSLLGPMGFMAVPFAELVCVGVTLPWMMKILRPGTPFRIAKSSAWILIPIGVAVVVGRATVHLLDVTSIAAVAGCVVTLLVYAVAAFVGAPGHMRSQLFGMMGNKLQRFVSAPVAP